MEENKFVTTDPQGGGTNPSAHKPEEEGGCLSLINAGLVFVLFIIFVMKSCDSNFKNIYEDDKPRHDRELVEKDTKGDAASTSTTEKPRQQNTKKTQETKNTEPAQRTTTNNESVPQVKKELKEEQSPVKTDGPGYHIEF